MQDQLKKLKTWSDELLRAGFCIVWVCAIPVTIMEFIYGATLDVDDPDKMQYLAKTGISIAVLVLAALAHAYLIKQAQDDE